MVLRRAHGGRVEVADPVDPAGRGPAPDRELVAHLRQVCDQLDVTASLLQAGHDGELLAYDGEMLAKTVHEAGDLLGGAAAALRARAELDDQR